MKAAYVDTSCFAAVLLQQPGHAAVADRVAEFDFVCASHLLEAELRSVMTLERVELSDAVFDGVRWVLPDRPLTAEMNRVLAAGYVRGADLWHLACALYVFDQPRLATFVSADARQQYVARALGFEV